MTIASCCLEGFEWEGAPVGDIGRLANNNSYITGDNPNAAVLLIHDLLGWTFLNIRLLADHYAKEAKVTVYVPDFFGGEALPFEPILKERWSEIDVAGFVAKNSRETREVEIFDCARELRAKYKKVGAVGFCYGGWAGFRLGAKQHQPPLVDFISAGHPTFLTKKDLDEVAVPVQILAPEHDPVYTAELKKYSFEALQQKPTPFDFQYFPGVSHGCFTRGDPDVVGERDAMVRGKNAAVGWFRQFLQDA